MHRCMRTSLEQLRTPTDFATDPAIKGEYRFTPPTASCRHLAHCIHIRSSNLYSLLFQSSEKDVAVAVNINAEEHRARFVTHGIYIKKREVSVRQFVLQGLEMSMLISRFTLLAQAEMGN